jgi:hypothetical protein
MHDSQVPFFRINTPLCFSSSSHFSCTICPLPYGHRGWGLKNRLNLSKFAEIQKIIADFSKIHVKIGTLPAIHLSCRTFLRDVSSYRPRNTTMPRARRFARGVAYKSILWLAFEFPFFGFPPKAGGTRPSCARPHKLAVAPPCTRGSLDSGCCRARAMPIRATESLTVPRTTSLSWLCPSPRQ